VGGKEGVSSIQMDIKIGGINKEIFVKALEQARVGRIHILGEMAKAIETPRADISEYAPRILTINIPVDRIKDVIGPGGKTIRSIVEKTGVKIDVEDDGRVLIASSDSAQANEAVALVRQYTADLEVGKYYMGRVVKIMDFGAFVEVLPGQEGLVHISQMANERINKVEDVCKEGDMFLVQVLDIDRTGRVRLSRKAALGVNPEDVLD
ncbi:S1 RNA-binding domain-containing protein, partial [bacterium]|nr:S1 RNA-binding domain-containing protein [bacterium]